MLNVGLTGGIAAGKSRVSALLAARGAVVIDSDLLAREVVAPGTDGLGQVVAEFGPGVLGPDGALDRPALAAVVFADTGRRAALNAIVHPLVRARSVELAAEAVARDPDAVLVHDIPLLVETGMADRFDLVVVVDAPRELRLSRLVRGRGMSESEALARIDAQASQAERLAAADLVVVNDATLAELAARVDLVWAELARRAGRFGG